MAKFLNYSVAINKILTVKDKNIDTMTGMISTFKSFLEKLDKGDSKIESEKKSLLSILDRYDITPSMTKGMKQFALSDFTPTVEAHKICQFFKKSFIPGLESIAINYEKSFNKLYDILKQSINVSNATKTALEAKEQEHLDLIKKIEEAYQNQSSKKYEEIFNQVIYNYRPFFNSLDDLQEVYNEKLDKQYQAIDAFVTNFEKLEFQRASQFDSLINSLINTVEEIKKSNADTLSDSFVAMIDIDGKKDITGSFTLDSVEETTKIPKFMPELPVNFDIHNFLESDKILITMQSHEYAISKTEIRRDGKLLASPNERVSIFKYNNKVYLVEDANNPLKNELNPEDLIFKPEYERYLAKVLGYGKLDQRRVIVVSSGDVCECMDEFGTVMFIPETNLLKL
ncbi:hypothetical protein TVAG_296000 [Trichomonas vaginalis G3]|uniref:Uncharacterized protein n=1 Tax=Trichomonas vaginalis (strain ATCC PRA-98 / G3) TaxID=412133 RepID=A2GLA5_TRIV3|nr:hypothetical protein TVAGG3_0537180 [Trichomonas vaginalis G3]EAX82063.1 hypothetical protein TVAG_296000 [Trichomonas vaginalis G3]KAI5519577.1 hypothetical protein TVAGG3_0537180 [Trichomonas vaginalis G3]|eukprot:XP_001294993.1 hypothetical protein [Trichomonas vaginalis G3]